MKQKKLLFSLFGICILLGLISCSEEDKSVFGDDIDIPELTDENTIQFTVDASGEWKLLQIIGGGGPMAIEWGDGRLQKVAKADGPITYRYRNNKTNRVRIWAEELDFCSVGDVLLSFSNLRLGYLPKMKTLNLNSFRDTPELNLSLSCPNVEDINIGNWADLERIDLSECFKLKIIDIYTHPKLTLLKLGQLTELNTLSCFGNDVLPSLSLKGLTGLNKVQCGSNLKLSAIEVDDEMNLRYLSISNCSFQSLDFLNHLPLLSELDCESNNLTTLDLSSNSLLSLLICKDNKALTSLQIPAEPKLQKIDCSFCQFDENELNAVFSSLNMAYKPHPEYPSNCVIYFNDNPGAGKCNQKILTDKDWNISHSPKY